MIQITRESAKQLRHFLTHLGHISHSDLMQVKEYSDLLDVAIEAPEQEPVAYQYRRFSRDPDDTGWGMWYDLDKELVKNLSERDDFQVRGLYTAAPAPQAPEQEPPPCPRCGKDEGYTVRECSNCGEHFILEDVPQAPSQPAGKPGITPPSLAK